MLTWHKGPATEVAEGKFVETEFTDEAGLKHECDLADIPIKDADPIAMLQVARRDSRKKTKSASGRRRQAHILTTCKDLSAAEVAYRMGSRWRQENYFRYGRMLKRPRFDAASF